MTLPSRHRPDCSWHQVAARVDSGGGGSSGLLNGAGGAGGGGGYGGGGGGYELFGGGGGSSFVTTTALSTSSFTATQTGNGQVVISYDPTTDSSRATPVASRSSPARHQPPGAAWDYRQWPCSKMILMA